MHFFVTFHNRGAVHKNEPSIIAGCLKTAVAAGLCICDIGILQFRYFLRCKIIKRADAAIEGLYA